MMPVFLLSLVIATEPPSSESEALTSTTSNPLVVCMTPRQRDKFAHAMVECQSSARLAFEGYQVTKVRLDEAEAKVDDREEEIANLRRALTAIPAVPTPTSAPDLKVALGIEGNTIAIGLGILAGLVAGTLATLGVCELAGCTF